MSYEPRTVQAQCVATASITNEYDLVPSLPEAGKTITTAAQWSSRFLPVIAGPEDIADTRDVASHLASMAWRLISFCNVKNHCVLLSVESGTAEFVHVKLPGHQLKRLSQ